MADPVYGCTKHRWCHDLTESLDRTWKQAARTTSEGRPILRVGEIWKRPGGRTVEIIRVTGQNVWIRTLHGKNVERWWDHLVFAKTFEFLSGTPDGR